MLSKVSKILHMPGHIEFGRSGEGLAAEWLEKKGFIILDRNWRHGRYEVDIIAGRSGVLHFIEVKSRRSAVYGYPEESVSRRKIGHIMQAATGWLLHWPGYRRTQYDVLAITFGAGIAEYVLFEDVSL
jgi:putative endonuclease